MEGATAEIVALPPVTGAELELPIGIDVELMAPACTEFCALTQRLCSVPILPGTLSTEFRIGLFDGANVFRWKLISVDILRAI